MVGGDSKIVLTCTHTHTHIPSLPKKRETHQMGVGIKEKELSLVKERLSTFPGVDSLATPLGT